MSAELAPPSGSVRSGDQQQPTFRRNLLPWYAVEAVASFATSLFSTGIFFFVIDVLHLPLEVNLWLSCVGGAAYVPGALLGGRLADRIGPRPTMQIMCVVSIFTALSGLFGVYTRNPAWFFGAVALFNFSSTMIWPALESALTRSASPMGMSRRMTVYNLSWSFGALVALAVGGSIATVFTWPGVFMAAAGAFVLCVLMARYWAIPANEIAAHHAAQAAEKHSAAPGDETVAAGRRAATFLYMAWLGNGLSYVGVNILMPVMPRLVLAAGIRSYALGTALAATSYLTRFLGFLLTWFWTRWHYRARWQLLAYGALATSFLWMLLSPNLPALIIGGMAFGLATAMLYAASLYYSMHVSSGAGQHAGIHEAVLGVGVVLGPMVAALVGGPADLPAKAAAAGIIFAAGGAGLLFLTLRAAPALAYRRGPAATEKP